MQIYKIDFQIILLIIFAIVSIVSKVMSQNKKQVKEEDVDFDPFDISNETPTRKGFQTQEIDRDMEIEPQFESVHSKIDSLENRFVQDTINEEPVVEIEEEELSEIYREETQDTEKGQRKKKANFNIKDAVIYSEILNRRKF
jgi:hypothetical protein